MRPRGRNSNYSGRSYFSVVDATREGTPWIGANAFGVTTPVTPTVGSVIGATVADRRFVAVIADPIRLTVPPAEAQRIVSGLSLLHVARLAPPYVESSRWVRGARLDRPYSTDVQLRILTLRYECVAVFDAANRRILQHVGFDYER